MKFAVEDFGSSELSLLLLFGLLLVQALWNAIRVALFPVVDLRPVGSLLRAAVQDDQTIEAIKTEYCKLLRQLLFFCPFLFQSKLQLISLSLQFGDLSFNF